MTKIEWTEKTWNIVTGCDPTSPGCKNCYARRMAKRLAGRCGYPGAPNEFDVTFHPDKLDEPLSWHKPTMCFVSSMGDLFHKDVPDEWLNKVWNVMTAAPQHTFQILTKRQERMRRFVRYADYLPPNIWLGITAEDQTRANERIPHLLATPAAVRFVSVEPMLGPVDLDGFLPMTDHDAQNWRMAGSTSSPQGREGVKLDWVIIGAETGPGRRPCRLEWVRNLVQQCKSAGVPVFVKKLEINGKVTGNMEDWPEDLRVREYPR